MSETENNTELSAGGSGNSGDNGLVNNVSGGVTPNLSLGITPEMLNNALFTSGGDSLVSQHRINLLDSIKLVPMYTGDDPLLSFAQFKAKFERCSRFFKWSPEVELFAIQLLLAGRAHQTYNSFSGQIKNSKDVFRVLEERFAPASHPGELLSEFWSFVQPPSMPVAEYLAQARQKVQAVTIAQGFPNELKEQTEEKWLLAMSLKNLDRQILRGVISKNPSTFKELETFALNEEKAIRATSQMPIFPNLNPFAQEFVGATMGANLNANVSGPHLQNIHSDKDEEIKELKELVKSFKTQLDQVTSAVGNLAINSGGSINQNNGGNNVSNFVSGSNVDEAVNVNRSNDYSNVRCFYCKKLGHTQRFCRQYQQAATWAQTEHFSNPSFYPQNRGGFSDNRNRGRGFGRRNENFNGNSVRNGPNPRGRGGNNSRGGNFSNRGSVNRVNNQRVAQSNLDNQNVVEESNVSQQNLNC